MGRQRFKGFGGAVFVQKLNVKLRSKAGRANGHSLQRRKSELVSVRYEPEGRRHPLEAGCSATTLVALVGFGM